MILHMLAALWCVEENTSLDVVQVRNNKKDTKMSHFLFTFNSEQLIYVT